MIRVLIPGHAPYRYRDDSIASGGITAGDVIKAGGGHVEGSAISVNGRLGSPSTPVRPGDSVRQSPLADNG